MPDSDPPPGFSVIYPEIDVRGSVAERLRAWTADQTLSRNRYRVVVVLTPDSEEEEAIQKLLGPEDKIIQEPIERDTAMWNAGAEGCDTRWLVFVEGHSPGDPKCLESLDRWLKTNPDSAVGNFEIGHPENYRMARISDRWFGEQGKRWEASWPRLHRAGFAIRRDVFETLNRFGPFGQFAPPLLSAKLHSAGYAMELVPGALVTHIDDRDLHGHHFDTIDFVLGECEAREIEEASFFENYFGHNDASRNRMTRRPGFFLDTIEAAARSIYRRRRIPPEFIPGMLRLAYDAARHSNFSIALDEAITLFEEAVLLHIPIPREWRYRWFVRAHRRVVETNARKWATRQKRPLEVGLASGKHPVETIGPWGLGGVHSLEVYDGRHFRWSEPFFTLRFSEAAEVQKVRLDTGRVRKGKNLGILFIASGRVPLPPSSFTIVGEGIVEVQIPARFSGRVENFGLTFVVSPLPTPKGDVRDDRRLGLPIFSIEIA